MQKVLIVYWSMSGNTKIMTNAMVEGCSGVDVTCVHVSNAPSLEGYDKYMFGCPSMGDEVLDEGEFEPYFASIETQLVNKKVALFGSYGWGDGKWMRDWEERVKGNGAQLFKTGLIVNETPTDDEQKTCKKFAASFMEY